MNDWLYLLHSLSVIACLYGALYLGKEALIAFIAICSLFANFFVMKQIMLFGFEITASEVYAIGAIGAVLILQEHWGKEAAKKATHITFFLLLFATISSYFHLSYLPSPHDTCHRYYEILLQPGPRLIAASLATFFIVQLFERTLFAALKKRSMLPFFVRAFCTTTLSIIIDTALFSFLGLYGIAHSLLDIFLVSTLVKLSINALAVPFIALSQLFLRKQTAS